MSAAEWAARYEAAWRAGDAEAAADLYAEDCVFRSHPFRETENAREYTRRVFAEESDIEARFGRPVADGDRIALEYSASWVEEGSEITISGITVMRLGPDGRAVDARDYWHTEPGRHDPPPGWGE